MGSVVRSIAGAPVALLVVIGLFLLMYGLIRMDDVVPLGQKTDPPVLSFKPEIQPRPTRVDPPDNTLPQPPPEPTIDRPRIDPTRGVTDVAPLAPTAGGDPIEIALPDTGPQPIVRIAPQGWERCITGDLYTGSVGLIFDIDASGNVLNVRVLNSTDTCLNRSATRAVEGWRYRPKTVDGQAVAQRDVRTTITFQAAE